MINFRSLFLFFLLAHIDSAICSTAAKTVLDRKYTFHAVTPSDINEHLPFLAQLAQECSSVIEIGLRDMISTWGILYGLSENPSQTRSYTGIDIVKPRSSILKPAKKIAQKNDINFTFIQANDMLIDIQPTEFLFIDSLHTYCHLLYELEKFSPKVTKYIAMHDTSEPWGNADDTEYHGNYSEYPAEFDKTKRGLWAAVEDFLANHPEWVLVERRLNNHGFTVLKRIQ